MTKKESVLKFLRGKYDPQAIVLTGSRTGEYYTEESDWDLILFLHEQRVPPRTLDYTNSSVLDIEFKTLSPTPEYLLSGSKTPIGNLTILFDKTSGEIDPLVNRTIEAYKRGPGKMTQAKYFSRKHYLKKKLSKLMAEQNEPLLFGYYVGQYYHFALQSWFELREIWPPRLREALAIIKKDDEKFYDGLKRMVSGKSFLSRADAADQIYGILFGE